MWILTIQAIEPDNEGNFKITFPFTHQQPDNDYYIYRKNEWERIFHSG